MGKDEETEELNELPRGKPRSIGAKTTGVARNEAGYIPLLRRTPVFDIWQTMQYDIAKTETLSLL